MATLKKTKNSFQDRLLLNAGQKHYRMLQREHSAILLTFIKLPVVIKTIVMSIFEWPFYTSFTFFLIVIFTLYIINQFKLPTLLIYFFITDFGRRQVLFLSISDKHQ